MGSDIVQQASDELYIERESAGGMGTFLLPSLSGTNDQLFVNCLSVAYSMTLTVTLTSNNVGCLIGKGPLG